MRALNIAWFQAIICEHDLHLQPFLLSQLDDFNYTDIKGGEQYAFFHQVLGLQKYLANDLSVLFFAAIKGEMSSLRLCACVCMHEYSINFGAVLDFSFEQGSCVCPSMCASFIIKALFLSSQSVCVYLQLLSDRATHGVKATTWPSKGQTTSPINC